MSNGPETPCPACSRMNYLADARDGKLTCWMCGRAWAPLELEVFPHGIEAAVDGMKEEAREATFHYGDTFKQCLEAQWKRLRREVRGEPFPPPPLTVTACRNDADPKRLDVEATYQLPAGVTFGPIGAVLNEPSRQRRHVFHVLATGEEYAVTTDPNCPTCKGSGIPDPEVDPDSNICGCVERGARIR
jgi:hypothetical protein